MPYTLCHAQKRRKERNDILAERQSTHPAPAQAVLVILALVPIIGIFYAIGSALGVASFLFFGFIFVLYWAGIKGMNPAEFAPALCGSLGGLGMAFLLHSLPTVLGMAGMAIAVTGVVVAIYLLIRGQASLIVNNAFMLLLTLGNPIIFERDADFAAAAVAIVTAAAYVGGLAFLMKRFSGGLRAKAQ